MALRDGSYARIWSAKQNGKVYSCNISVSHKDKQTGEYKTDFSGYVNFGNTAAEKVATLGLPEIMDRNNPIGKTIKIKGSPDISTYYNKEATEKLLAAANGNDGLVKFIRSRANEKYITIWDFELEEGNSAKASSNSNKTANKPVAPTDDTETEADEDELPF